MTKSSQLITFKFGKSNNYMCNDCIQNFIQQNVNLNRKQLLQFYFNMLNDYTKFPKDLSIMVLEYIHDKDNEIDIRQINDLLLTFQCNKNMQNILLPITKHIKNI